MGKRQRWYIADTKYRYCWTDADQQKQTVTESIYSGPDVVQNHYQDRL